MVPPGATTVLGKSLPCAVQVDVPGYSEVMIEEPIATVRSYTCTCCMCRGVRKMICLDAVNSVCVAICPDCDARASDLSAADVLQPDRDDSSE